MMNGNNLCGVKNAMTISWHDLLLQAFARAEPAIKKVLSQQGYTDIQIEDILSGKVEKAEIIKEPCAVEIARERMKP